jgi:phosphatidylserine decarboxylase
MTIHREGYKSIAIGAIVFALINIISFKLFGVNSQWLVYLLFALTLFLFLFLISFFRIPKRQQSFGDNKIIAPADGKVVVIEEVVDVEYFKDKRLQISIFMSPANVHQNHCPTAGEVVYNQYHKGKYLVAWHPKSSTENERHSVVIANANGKKVLVKQIAGALAKRIVNYLAVNQKVTQNQELGFIKFGSRVDLLLPVGTKVNVALNQAVQGGVTVIAEW